MSASLQLEKIGIFSIIDSEATLSEDNCEVTTAFCDAPLEWTSPRPLHVISTLPGPAQYAAHPCRTLSPGTRAGVRVQPEAQTQAPPENKLGFPGVYGRKDEGCRQLHALQPRPAATLEDATPPRHAKRCEVTSWPPHEMDALAVPWKPGPR